MALITGNKLTKQFGGLTAVMNVDFAIEPGGITGLIGPNGAGKTTLLNMISGELTPTAGEIRFQDRRISGLKPHLICKRGIARTFQAVHLFRNLSVWDNVALGRVYGGRGERDRAARRREVGRLLEFSGVSHRADTLAKDLPIAEQKLVELTRALATGPKLLLLDEVISGLNPAEIETACGVIQRINDQGTTIIMVEHVMQVIMSMSTRIMVLNYGEKIAEGTPREIASDQKVIEIYLGDEV